MNELDIREVEVLVHGDEEPMIAYVVVGYQYEDGVTDPDLDERIYYYFKDEAEFEQARTTGLEYFSIVGSE